MPFGPDGAYYSEDCVCDGCSLARSGGITHNPNRDHAGEAYRELGADIPFERPVDPVPVDPGPLPGAPEVVEDRSSQPGYDPNARCNCDECMDDRARLQAALDNGVPSDPYARRSFFRDRLNERITEVVAGASDALQITYDGPLQQWKIEAVDLDDFDANAEAITDLWGRLVVGWTDLFSDYSASDRQVISLGAYDESEPFRLMMTVGQQPGYPLVAQITRWGNHAPYFSQCNCCGEESYFTDNNLLMGYPAGYCYSCTRSCCDCGDRFVPEDDEEQCRNCSYYAYCDRCGEGIREYDDYAYDDYEEQYYCYRCNRDRYVHPGEADTEELEDATVLAGVSLLMDSMDGARTIRRVGLEIEGGGSMDGIARHLNNAGVSPWSEPMGYHFQSRDRHGDSRGWSVESDATCDWEIVSPVLDLTDEADAELAADGIRAIAGFCATQEGWHDYRTGLHIHVGVEHLPITAAYRIGRIWNYLEDTMYRLSAAKWRSHRALTEGDGYCHPVPKEIKTQMEFQRVIQRAGRYSALSFQNYINAHLQNCSCGNCSFGSWDTCICESLGKCTFEFRVFNATSNVLKIKAYIALVQAIVSYGERMEPLSDEEWDSRFPDLPFNTVRRDNAIQEELTKDRLRFIFSELPMTADEKEAVLYCVRNSDLAPVWGEQGVDADQLILEEVGA